MKTQHGFNRFLMLAAMAALVGGCGSDSDSEPNPKPPVEPQVLTGVFLDSEVEGLTFATDSQSGTTNSGGEFLYLDGERVLFSLGATQFPEVDAGERITPLELFNTQDPTTQAVINTLRLLQSLDADGNPENGITIPEAVAAALEEVTIDVTGEDFETQMAGAMETAGLDPTTLVSEEDALAHFDDTVNPGFSAADLNGQWVSMEWLTPRFGFYDPAYFDYRLANWSIEEGTLTVNEFTLAGKTYEPESYAVAINDRGQMQVDDDEELAQLDTGEQMMLWWDEDDGRQRLAAALKRADSYQLADLQGEWLVGSLYTPAHQNGDPAQYGFGVYHLQVNDTGVVNFTPVGGSEDDIDVFTLGLEANGHVVDEDEGYIHLSANKDVMMQVAVWDGVQQEMMLAVKQPEQLEVAGLEGRWYSVTVNVPAHEHDPALFNYSRDEVVFDAEGNSAWHQLATDDPEADLEVVDTMKITLVDGMLKDEYNGYWLVNASYDVAINLYPEEDGAYVYAMLVRMEK
ncbi:hypothetical protein FCL40_11720 [Ferrimonas sediminicola]|uniref:Uncharacterized protein n=1 Tax=Ferrimonas sediminicola TaxID=2569538 RepID=A0A4U1BBM4_9GAMM|nr:hypothetical protein [Ferrimonas sediminicola]TKB48378.1 hypothetical protein FCL40_11720 [Ferrimonas sediminicola]